MDTKKVVMEAQGKIIDSLVTCEESIALLYSQYAIILKEMEPFWSHLAQEETKHAAMLNSLHRILERGHIFYNIGKFDETSVKAIIDRIKSEVAMAEKKMISKMTAIETALHIETSLIDGHFYDTVKSDAPEFRHIAERLASDTKKHIKAIEEQILL